VLITFFDIKGTVHFPFIPQGETVNQAYYVEILKRLPEAVHREKRLGSTTGFSITTMHQLTRHCQGASGPKINYQNVTPTLLS
jgi:hypothetical protein